LFTEALGDIGATCDVSRLAVSGPAFTSRVQGSHVFFIIINSFLFFFVILIIK